MKNIYLLLLVCVAFLPATVFGQKIVYVTSPTTSSDLAYSYVKKFCADNGILFYEIAPSCETLATELETADLMMISAIANGSADSVAAFVNNVGNNPSIPIMCWSNEYLVALKMTVANGTAWYQQDTWTLHVDEAVAGADVVGGLSGIVPVYSFTGDAVTQNDRATLCVNIDQMAPGAQVLLWRGNNNDPVLSTPLSNRASAFIVDTNADLLDGTKANARRYCNYFAMWTTGGNGSTQYNDNTDILFASALSWLFDGSIISGITEAVLDVDYSIANNVIRLNETMNIAVYNMLGAHCFGTTASELNMNALPSGIYIIKLDNGSKATSIKFFKK